MKSIFDYKDYKNFLKALCQEQRGLLTKLATAAECQKSYFSSCLKDKCHLTLDHIHGISEFLSLGEQEESYFFLLFEKDKCTTLKLKRKLENKLKLISREAFRLKNQQEGALIIKDSEIGLSEYYSSWIFMAIHSLTSINKYQSIEKISEKLMLSKATTEYHLQQLIKLDLVKFENNKYFWNTFNMHLSDDSNWINRHHNNWRINCIHKLQKKDGESLHYTVVQSMSESDFEILKKKIAQFIKEFNKISDPSNPEESYNLNIDFYRL